MSNDFRLKKLRGSGGYIMASVTDDQQRKGNLGGPDLFLAPVGRIDMEKISKYFCNTCEKDYEGSPKIDYETPNEIVAENLVLLEKGRYVCTTCGSVLAEYRNFIKPNESEEIGLAKQQSLASQNVIEPSVPIYTAPQSSYQSEPALSGVTTFNSITGISVYDSEARKIGIVKQVGIQMGQAGVVLIVTKNDGNDIAIKWDEIRKIGEIVLLGGIESVTSTKCDGCGYVNNPDSKFCESCGNKLK
jgi:sporulation protein YlmC with PRC-barrel domain